jgi:hypothetical protein
MGPVHAATGVEAENDRKEGPAIAAGAVTSNSATLLISTSSRPLPKRLNSYSVPIL